ncbi:MAG: PAS domain-containing protein [Chthoniobacter sp.]
MVASQNRAVTRLLGYDSGGLTSTNFFELVHAEDLPRFYSAFFNVIEAFRPEATVEFRFRHQDSVYRTLEATMGKTARGRRRAGGAGLPHPESPRLIL